MRKGEGWGRERQKTANDREALLRNATQYSPPPPPPPRDHHLHTHTCCRSMHPMAFSKEPDSRSVPDLSVHQPYTVRTTAPLGPRTIDSKAHLEKQPLPLLGSGPMLIITAKIVFKNTATLQRVLLRKSMLLWLVGMLILAASFELC